MVCYFIAQVDIIYYQYFILGEIWPIKFFYVLSSETSWLGFFFLLVRLVPRVSRPVTCIDRHRKANFLIKRNQLLGQVTRPQGLMLSARWVTSKSRFCVWNRLLSFSLSQSVEVKAPRFGGNFGVDF